MRAPLLCDVSGWAEVFDHKGYAPKIDMCNRGARSHAPRMSICQCDGVTCQLRINSSVRS